MIAGTTSAKSQPTSDCTVFGSTGLLIRHRCSLELVMSLSQLHVPISAVQELFKMSQSSCATATADTYLTMPSNSSLTPPLSPPASTYTVALAAGS
jgi:hypothetical protein